MNQCDESSGNLESYAARENSEHSEDMCLKKDPCYSSLKSLVEQCGGTFGNKDCCSCAYHNEDAGCLKIMERK